ncbi:hypothetical protein LJK87_08510 [Paenibacillus sp. P25]|nr:hypothetical protein LJK87_08510 [Paenibacillus sp. P25]
MVRRRMLAVSCVVLMLGGAGLSGCGESKQSSFEASSGTSVPAPVKLEEMQSSSERQLVFLFKALIQMDKKEGLALTRAQAESLLPIVRKNTTEGELPQTDVARILEKLTTEQKRYYEDFQDKASKLKKPDGVEKRADSGLSKEEREKMIAAFRNERRHEAEADPQHIEPRPGDPPDGGPFLPGGGKSVEQSLIELLESKLK